MMPARRSLLALVLVLFTWLMMAACAGEEGPPGPLGPAGPPGPLGPVGPAGEAATASQTYIGAERCGQCHEDLYATYILSGHPNDLTAVNGEAPVLPFDSVTGGIPEPPDGYGWADIRYVVGGFAWAALFVDREGYVITGAEGEATKYVFANDAVGADAGWMSYAAGQQVPFDCAVCHATGYRPVGHQDGADGIVGTWELEGVQCERCHGPGSRHADDPHGVVMTVNDSSRLCGECHVRGDRATIDAEDGFAQHNQQFSDLFNSKHFALDCVTCHDPHASAVHADEALNPARGQRQVCESCHWPQEFERNRRHLGVECVDCHMPPMAKSAQADLAIFTADVHAHQFSINPDPEAPQFSPDGSTVRPYITLDYACRHCHNGELATEKDAATLADMARGYHTPLPPTPTPEPEPEPEETPEATPGATPTP